MHFGAAITVLLGAGLSGWADTKYAFNQQGQQTSVLGMSPGLALGVVAIGVGFLGRGLLGSTVSSLALGLGFGGVAFEAGKWAANATAQAMAKQSGTQGLNGGIQVRALPERFRSANDLNGTFDRLEALRQTRMAA